MSLKKKNLEESKKGQRSRASPGGCLPSDYGDREQVKVLHHDEP